MFKLLFVLIPVLVFVDPFLLYLAWPRLSFWQQVVLLVVYPLVATFYTRSKTIQEGDLVTRVIRSVVRFIVWYPGPITKFVSLLLILPPVEKGLARTLTRHFQRHLMQGMTQFNFGGLNAPGASSGPESSEPDDGPLPGDENLKRARGKIIE